MKSRHATAARYAKALFSIARAAGTAEAIVRELEQFAAELRGNRELEVVLLRPWIKPAERLIRKSLRDEDHRRIIEDAIGRVDRVS